MPSPWLQHNITADLRVALHHAAGLPPNIQEHPKPQSAIVRVLAAEAGAGTLRDLVARSIARLAADVANTMNTRQPETQSQLAKAMREVQHRTARRHHDSRICPRAHLS